MPRTLQSMVLGDAGELVNFVWWLHRNEDARARFGLLPLETVDEFVEVVEAVIRDTSEWENAYQVYMEYWNPQFESVVPCGL
jgi:hypothetical protein